MRKPILAFAAAASLLAPAAAQAHVTVQPDRAPAGAFTRLDVRVPSERDDAGTTKVDVQLPPGFVFVSYQPLPGWRVKLTHSKLDKPVETDEGDKIDERVSRVTWTGDGKQGIVGPGQFQDFGLSVRIPDGKAGDALTFKALQTYSDGQVVRWIGAQDSDTPAPIVTVTGAQVTPAATATPTAANTSSSNRLSITALVVGALGLLTAVAALVATTRQRRVRA